MMTAEQKAQWLADRCGKLTASNMARAMAFLKNGNPAAERTKLMQEILAERLTGFSVPHVITPAMEWGTLHEDEAADRFVELTGRDLRLSRFYEHQTIGNFGATPDRELDDGLVEIKCPTTTTFVQWCIDGIVPMQHRQQMCAQLACSGKKWAGFIAYDPRIKDERKQLFMRKFVPTETDLAEVEQAAITFLNEVDAMFDQFVSAAA